MKIENLVKITVSALVLGCIGASQPAMATTTYKQYRICELPASPCHWDFTHNLCVDQNNVAEGICLGQPQASCGLVQISPDASCPTFLIPVFGVQ